MEEAFITKPDSTVQTNKLGGERENKQQFRTSLILYNYAVHN